MVNKVILVGNLGRDPERRSTPSGQQVATFSVATSRRWRDRDGNKQEQTEWHNVVCWGRQAEVAGEYLKKGRQIYVEGRLQTRKWIGRDKAEKSGTEIVARYGSLLSASGLMARFAATPAEPVRLTTVPANSGPPALGRKCARDPSCSPLYTLSVTFAVTTAPEQSSRRMSGCPARTSSPGAVMTSHIRPAMGNLMSASERLM